MKRKLLFLCLLVTSLLNIDAKVKLQPMFSDNMVLQQKTNTPIWGEARAGKKVTVLPSWNGKSYTTQADAAGQWKITVETPGAGGPYEITISDGQKFTLRNVMIGEVWLCTGQSNMEMPMRGWDTPMNADEIANSGKYNNIRMLQVDEVLSTTPKNTLTVKSGGWMTCSPETVRDFSATGFFFGKNIEERINVPVGLIMTCWGGTPVESWISGERLRQVDAFKARIDSMPANELVRERQYQSYLVNYDSWFLDQIKREHSAD
ncbi:MAG: sialate O-acetylesterase, partial [Prevotella sp.]|nr:sialate O-acetylesterase [Prevotella sp.]